MPSSYTALYIHMVWSTTLRTPWISAAVAPRLYGLLSERARDLDCVALAVGGVEDHVHALVGLHASVDVARLARELKAPSSGFIRRVLGVRDFEWQDGYSSFTLRATELDTVRRYILDQPRHHAEGTSLPEWECHEPTPPRSPEGDRSS